MNNSSLASIQEIQPGNHIGWIYETEEEHQSVVSHILRRALQLDQKVIYILDTTSVEMLLAYLEQDGFDGQPFLDRGQLVTFSPEETYLRDGAFEPERMIALLQEETDRALAEGYTALTATGEMTWALDGALGSDRLAEYERKLNRFLVDNPTSTLLVCQYDQKRFDARMLLDMLRSHPVAVIGGEIYENFYYAPPGTSGEEDTFQSDFEHWHTHLRHRKHADKSLLDRDRALALLSVIGREIVEVLDPDRLFQKTVALVQQRFGYHHVALFTVDRDRGQLVMRARAGDFDTLFPPHHNLYIGEGLVGYAALLEKTVLSNDVESEPRYVNHYPDRIPTRSEMSVPIHNGSKLLGVLDVQSLDRDAFDDTDVLVFETLADQLSPVMNNAQLYRETHQRAERLATVNRIAQAASATINLKELVETVYREITLAVKHDAFFIALYDAEREELDFQIQVDTGIRAPAERHPLGTGLTSHVVTKKRPLLIDDMAQAPEYQAMGREWGTMAVPASWLGVPMRIGERVTGVISVQAYHPHAYGEEDQQFLSTIADQVAMAVENARLFHAQKRQRELAEALAEAAVTVNSTLDLDQVLDRILEQVARVIEGDTFNVMLYDNDQAHVTRWQGYDQMNTADMVRGLTVSLDAFPYLRTMKETGEPVAVPDVAHDPRWTQREGWDWQRSYVAAPIFVRGETAGFLNVDGSRAGQFNLEDARRLKAFASYTGIAIENAQLYHKLRSYTAQLEERVHDRTVALERKNAQLEAILHSTTDGIIVTDEKGRIIQINQVAQHWLGKVLPANDVSRLRQEIQNLVERAGERPEAVLELDTMDLQLGAAPISGPLTENAGVVVAVHDVSYIKELERIKSRFVANVSHELRTPVTTIRLYVELLRRCKPEDWSKYLDTMEREVERQAHLVEDVLRISRLDAGQMVPDFEAIQLDELVNASIASHQMLAQSHGLALLKLQQTEASPAAWGDPDQMIQVVDNLVLNAIIYTREGGEVVVSVGAQEREGRLWATATVSDTGIGIAKEDIPHIFERFYRGTKSEDKQYLPGAGLGLAIVKEIVDLHGGQIEVESEVGKGSTFKVWLPLAEDQSSQKKDIADSGITDLAISLFGVDGMNPKREGRRVSYSLAQDGVLGPAGG
ncbi:MAG: GAF domain-containing protein [Anaerolineae bacterium]|nr:GAF domain-containing protein [Anaerolineae bacterium]